MITACNPKIGCDFDRNTASTHRTIVRKAAHPFETELRKNTRPQDFPIQAAKIPHQSQTSVPSPQPNQIDSSMHLRAAHPENQTATSVTAGIMRKK